MGKELKEGDRAPDFELANQDNEKVSLNDFRNRWVVVYFYPKDDTPGCTVEAVDFTKRTEEFKKFNAVVVGISADPVKSHCSFIEKHKLGITLLSDEDKKAVDAYGVWGLKFFLGRQFFGISRSTFLINPNGKISKTWYKVKAEGHADEVLRTLKAMKE